MADAPRVTYADLEVYGGDSQPPRLTLLLLRVPDGAYYPQVDPSDIPAEFLDTLRLWLVGAPTELGTWAEKPSDKPQVAVTPVASGAADGGQVATIVCSRSCAVCALRCWRTTAGHRKHRCPQH